MKLLLIRHGETPWNLDGRYQGRSDPPLTPRGEDQARALAQSLAQRLAQSLASAQATRLVAGPLQRAQATARAIGAAAGLRVDVDPRLTELSYGAWEGLRQAEVKLRWPELLRQWKRQPDQACLPGGESLAALRQRVRSFMDDAAAGLGTTVAVTHAGVIRAMVLEASGAPLAAFRAVRIDNATLTTLCARHGRWWVRAIGVPGPYCTRGASSPLA
ncbi:MAG: histidine phosphatase family protein [Burkholderiales bacterium]|nr:histidine phosphatase family protein [Burkholderiales bacterium]